MNLTGLINVIKRFLCGVHRTEYFGLENIDKNKLYVFAANHVSAVDPVFVMNKVENLAIMAKKELFEKPLIKDFVEQAGAIPIKRNKNDVRGVLTATHVITQNKKNLLIFPQGTRHAKEKHIQAKNGAVVIAASAGVEIIPVYLCEERGIFKKYFVSFGAPLKFTEDELLNKNECTEKLMNEIYSMRKEYERIRQRKNE